MIRLSTLSGYALAVCAATALFWTSQTVQKAEDRLERVRHDLAREHEALHVLTAEWDYLNRPERIEALARKYLDMKPPGDRTLIAGAGDIPPPAMAEVQTSAPSVDSFAQAQTSGESPEGPNHEAPDRAVSNHAASDRLAAVTTLASIAQGSGERR